MKNLFITGLLFISCLYTFAQETSFGITAGFLNVSGKIEVENNDLENENRSGAFAGIEFEWAISEKFHFQPEAIYARNNDYGLLMLPLVMKYYPVPKINIQFGPQIDYSTDPYPIDGILAIANANNVDIDEDDFTRVGISLATGFGYDLNEHFFLDTRYTFQLNDVYTGDLNISIKGNIFTAGVGYRF